MASEELREMLKQSVKTGEFVLSSGKKSNYYINIKEVSTKPDILRKIAREMARLIDRRVDRIAGIAVGGIPLVVALSLETNVPFLIVRKEKKDYGMETKIEGEFFKGEKVVVVEDVTTTGQTALEAVRAIRRIGKCDTVIAVVDRREGAEELLKKNGIELIFLFTAEELI
jgi:orotate phosphoribosyltransferase